MTNKEKYELFCSRNYVQIYSKPWWLDAICGEDNWDVWIYELGNDILAAMPYYVETRGHYRYITKAPFTQINGIQFSGINGNAKRQTIAAMEEKIINAACDYIESLKIDVYEQQYPYTFKNWQPFYWRNYKSILRYTYVIPYDKSMDVVKDEISSKYKGHIKKGQRSTEILSDFDKSLFKTEHEKIFLRQNLPDPLSNAMWERMYGECKKRDKGITLAAVDENGNIHGVMFLVWDEKAIYLLLGGYMPEYAWSQAYPALTYHAISLSRKMGLGFDFEGSMIKRIACSMREYGGIPMPYFRIRKVFNPDIIKQEAQKEIEGLLK